MELDPRRLRVFLTILRSGGIVAAADSLHLSASAVSQQLTRLEQEVGARLVTRTPRGTVPTSSGLILAEVAEDIEKALTVGRSRLLDSSGGSEGQIRIGSFSSFLRTIIIPNLPTWLQDYPGLEIHLEEHDSQSSMTQLLRSGELDAAVMELNPGDVKQSVLPPGMMQIPLLDEPWRLLVPAGKMSTKNGLDVSAITLPWLETDVSYVNSEAIQSIREAIGAPVPSAHRYQQPLTALALVRAGQGIVAMPLLALRGLDLDGIDVIDLPGVGTRRIVVRKLKHEHVQRTPVDTFVSLLKQVVSDLTK